MVSRKPGLGSVAALCLAGVAFALAVWQFQRAEEKRALAQSIASGQAGRPIELAGFRPPEGTRPETALDQARLSLRGQWLPQTTLYLDNRLLDGKPGVQVITALLLADQRVAWVNRGWAPKPPGDQGGAVQPYRDGTLHRPAATGTVVIEAVGYASLMQRMALSQDQGPQTALWTNLDWEQLAAWMADRLGSKAASGAGVWPLVFWQTSDSMDGLTRHLPQPPADAVDKHLGYALQWLLFCAVALFFAWRLSKPEAAT